ncbi:MAG: hypothetical protein WBE75_00270 [Candidatus Omnitrophota bacterium]|jgi:KDO2-lipid IV(A) lauroyltransferase
MFFYFLYRTGQFIALRLPLKSVYGLAVFIADLHFLFCRHDRRAVYFNLKAIFPRKSENEIRTIRRSIFRNFAKYLVDFFRYPILNREFIDRNVSVRNIHYLDEALANGKGGIVLAAHIGNWELGGVVVAALHYPFSAVALTHKNEKVNRFFDEKRETMGIKVIPLRHSLRKCFRVLKDNGLVALLGDREFTRNGGVIAEFLGKRALLPQGPAFLALKSGAAIIPGCMVRNTGDRFTLMFEKPIYPPDAGSFEDNLRLLQTETSRVIEKWIRSFPEQWYVFRQYWADGGNGS